jgi:hypothetical protein
MTQEYNNVNEAALHILADQLVEFGAFVKQIEDDAGVSGSVYSVAGDLSFTWQRAVSRLRVTIAEDAGHFSRALLIGGMRQMVEEAVEQAARAASTPVPAPTAPRV